MSVLGLDFETRSRLDLKKAGAHRYAEHPSTDIWCMAFAFDDEEPEVWTPLRAVVRQDAYGAYSISANRLIVTNVNGIDPVLQRVYDHVQSGGEIRAWNAQFERLIWRHILGPRYGFPVPVLDQFVCSAAEAAALSLPRKLKEAAAVLKVPVQIADDKHRLILQMAKPRKPTKTDPREWWDDDDKQAALQEACKQDVRAERAISARLRPLSDYERRVYLHDQRMNDRGVTLDRPLIIAAQNMVTQATLRANAELDKLTGGEVEKVTNTGDLTLFLQSTGLDIDNVRKDTLRDLLAEDGLTDLQRAVINVRSESAKSSTSKIKAMLSCICNDDRARGLHLYHGASTGRWSGKLVQPQNFPRTADPMSGQPTVKNVERFIPLVLAGEYDLVDIEYPVLIVIAVMLRSMLKARPGYRLMAGDFAQIEARVLAWIAEQNDLVLAFASGGKIYEPMAARIYGVPVEEITKDDPRRQIGKVTVLGAGFQMGAKTFNKQTKVQTGVDLGEELAEKSISAYREINGMIVQFWKDIENAAFDAVATPGKVTSVGRKGAIKYVVKGKYLFCILPSGRMLSYALPKIELRTTPWGQKKECVTFAAIDGYTKKWRRHAAYGGLWTENVVQAMARDLIAAAMLRLDKAGYPDVLTVHDEVVCEVQNGVGNLDEMIRLMEVLPRWADGLPVAAEGWEGERYRK